MGSLDFTGDKSPESAFYFLFFLLKKISRFFLIKNSPKFQLLISKRSQKVAVLAPHPVASSLAILFYNSSMSPDYFICRFSKLYGQSGFNTLPLISVRIDFIFE
jgi:hypothetical protein